MTAIMSEELQKVVDAQKGMPVKVEHPVTHKMYVIVEQPTHEQAMLALRKQKAIAGIQAGVNDMEAGRGTPIEKAETQLRKELGFPKK